MATLLPQLSDSQLTALPSQAEAKVYRALRDRLPDRYVVLFEVGWILRREDEQAKDGEADFIVCDPDSGYLCIEVKGGGIAFDGVSGKWFSVDRNGQKHEINNPIQQALKAKYSIRTKLSEHPRSRELGLHNVLRGHAVWFPDVGDTVALSRPDMPPVLIGGARDIENPKHWVNQVFAYWSNDVHGHAPLGRRGVEAVRDVFARTVTVAPLVSSRLAEQEARRIALTNDQIRVLDFLQSHRRVAVSGGAGTGKTVLAVEKAHRLATEGFRTLLTCYNRQLADHLAGVSGGVSNLEVMSFHQLCYRQADRAHSKSSRDLVAEAKATYPGKDLFDVQLPNALAYSLEVLPDRFDAIVCDEGQDFRDEFWVPLELMLSDYEHGPFYVFYDDNQNIYRRASTFPIRDAPFTLTTNCRNTAPIHQAAYRHYRGVPVQPPENQGDEVRFEEANSRDAQVTKLTALIVDLIAKQGVSANSIVVLIADAAHKTEYYRLLKRQALPRPATWVEEAARGGNTVLMDTVQRFKGLEAPIVILWGLDGIDPMSSEELLYVALSRAKSLLVIVGTSSTCAAIRE
jgi:superfamily I DNA/RNA helicase